MRYYRSFSYNREPVAYKTTTIEPDKVLSLEELKDPAIQSSIQNLLSKNVLSDWEKQFLTSINEFFTIKNKLTSAQYLTFKKIENKYSDEVIAKCSEFRNNFTDDMRQDMKIVANVYKKQNSPYYRELVKNILEDDSFIPTEQVYEKFMNNKYAKGYLNAVKSTPKFNIGDTVCPSYSGRHFVWKNAIIIQNTDISPVSYAAGSKRYLVLPYGETKTVEVCEVHIKYHHR